MIPVLHRQATRTPQPKTPRSKVSRMRLVALLLLLLSSLAATAEIIHIQTSAGAVADDWPTYLHDPQRSSASNDTTISTSNAGQLVKNWTFKTTGVIAASPTVVGGTVYVGSWDGYEYALNAATGQLIWKTYLGISTTPACNPPQAGITSTATVLNGVVYVGGGDAYWYALDATSGAVLWRVYTGDNSATGGHYNWSSPLIYNGYAYIGIASMGDCPLVQGQLLQVNLSTHQIVNTFNVVPQGQVGGGIWDSPSLDTTTNTIFVTTGTRNDPSQTLTEAMLAIDATTLILKSSWAVPTSQEVLNSDFGTTPTLFNDASGNPLVAATNKNGYVYAFNRNNLAAGPIWMQQIANGGECPTCGDGSVSSGAFGNNTLFLAAEETTINGQGYKGSVNALDPATGNFLWRHIAPSPVIPALTYSNGLIIDGAGNNLEVLDATSGTRLYSYAMGGSIYAPASVSNGQIFTGDTNGNIYAFGLPTDPPPTPIPDPNCPNGWSCQDIGNPIPAGSETVLGGTWSIQAGGSGIGSTSDQFRLISQSVSGDTQITTQVISQQATSGSAQAGLMIRQTSDPTSPYYSVLLTNSNGLIVLYRSAFGGTTATLSNVTISSLPLYLAIQRVGDQFQAATSSDGVTYTLVPGSTVIVPLPAAIMEGIAASSNTQGTLDTATYKSVSIGSPNTPFNPSSPATPCPSNWNCLDIGNPVLVGDQSLSNGTWTLKGAGTDINGYSDQFHFVSQSLAADGSVSAHILTQTNTNPSAKAGIMLRQGTDAGSPYYAAFVTPGNGTIVQYRSTQGLRTTILPGPSVTVPAYLMIARSGNTYCAYTSTDGVNWSYIIGTCVTLNLNGPVLAGLAVTSNNTNTLSIATIDTVNISTTAPPPPSGCPSGWTCGDVGIPNPTGNQSLNGNTWTVQGGGGDIWGLADQFHLVAGSLAADGSVSAHVLTQTNTSVWAKAGVMLRQSTDQGSPFYFAAVTPGNGIVVQYRTTLGASAQQLAIFAGTVPTYLMVARSGSTYTAYTSTDGTTWNLVAGSSVTLNMSGSVLAGLAVTSHNGGALSTVTFDTVSFSTTLPPPPGCTTNWSCADIGTPALAGSQSQSSSTWTIQGGGNDIWGTADQFHFVWQSLAGDGSVSAHVLTQTNTSVWAKAGVMLRQSTDQGSPFYDIVVTPGNGITVQYRTTLGGSAQQLAAIAGTVPTYLMVARSGSTYTAYTSTDGTTWNLVAGSSVTLNMSGSVLAGLAVTSHNGGALSTVTFDTVSFSTTLPPPPGCTTNWSCADIGTPALAGSQSQSGSTWTIQGGGNDIWGTADQFHFVWQSLAGDGSVSAHVLTQTNTSVWAKAGVMLRQSTDQGSPFYFAAVTPGNGIVVQYRTTLGGSAQQLAAIAGTVPAYLMVARSGSTYTAYTSTDGTTWNLVAGSSVTLNMSGPLSAGLAVTSHNGGTLSTVTFDTVSFSTTLPPPPGCTTNWSCADIGTPALAGSQSQSSSTWTIQGGGNDIWGTADQFHFVWQSLAGDGSVSAHVLTQTNTSVWAKAGVMLRQSTDPGSPFYDIVVTPGNGITVQYRTTLGGSAQQLAAIAGTVPTYLMVARSGSTYTAYTSSDGTTWNLVAGSSVTLNMSGPLSAGLAVTSHNGGTLSTVTFDSVSVSTTVP